jgi:hypothetical protein
MCIGYDNPEDEIDAEAIVAQLQQAITLQRTATGLRKYQCQCQCRYQMNL